MRPDDLYLVDLIEAAAAIAQYLDGVAKDRWDGDEMLRSAVLHKLMVIGEAAARLSPATRASMPDIPWPAVVGFRNLVVHEYFALDTDIVWHTARVQVPIVHQVAASCLAGARG